MKWRGEKEENERKREEVREGERERRKRREWDKKKGSEGGRKGEAFSPS